MNSLIDHSTIRNPLHFPQNSKPKSSRNENIRVVVVSSALGRSNSNGSSEYEGRLVEKNLIVLRKRIHEMKIVERNYEPPKEWMEWEKQMYAQYDDYICTILGLVQTQLMNARPSVALGALALLTLSVPTSAFLLALHSAQAARHLINF